MTTAIFTWCYKHINISMIEIILLTILVIGVLLYTKKHLRLPNNFFANWKDLWIEVKDRILSPLKHPIFVFYFFSIIVAVGGMGVWISVFQFNRIHEPGHADRIAFARNLTIYLLAILSTAFTDLFLSKSKGSLQMLAIVILVMAGILAALSQATELPVLAGCYAIFGTILSLLLWWMTNAHNTMLHEKPDDKASLGGDPTAQTSGTTATTGLII